MENVFEEIETDDKAPESLKESILSEVDTIRATMQVVTLFGPSIFDVLGSIFAANKPLPTTHKQ
jgi:hypothetical protein